METLKDVLDFVILAIDLPLKLEGTRQKYVQARECLGSYQRTGIVPDDKIKEAQNRIDKILYIEDNKKDNPNSYWDFEKKIFELIDRIAILNGCTTVRKKYYINLYYKWMLTKD